MGESELQPAQFSIASEKSLALRNVSRTTGRLKFHLSKWKKLTSDSRVLDWIEGYKIPFAKPVVQNMIPRESSWSQKEKMQIKEHIIQLISKGAINNCHPQIGQFVSSIFLIPKPDGSSRLILNLKKLNEFIETDHFKMEDYKVACKLVSHNCFMGKLDLKDAYYMIPIDKNYKKYLRFAFDGNLYEFNCLPFGLNTAPYIFTKIMKPVVGYLRNLGFLSVVYLDDLLLLGDTFSECLKNINASLEVLESLGFIINEDKSCRIPAQTCKFLGFILNSQKMTLELPPEKRYKIHNQIYFFKKLKKCKIRDFAQLIGSLISCCPAIKYGWAHVKNLERERYLALLKSRDNYDEDMQLNRSLQEDFSWWETNILYRVSSISSREYSCVIFSDASLTGWGVSCNDNRAHGLWSESERLHHINYLELLSAFLGLKCFAKNLRSCNILLRIDNTTAISYINRMGGIRFKKLSNLAKAIWEWCEECDLFIFASYIASKNNAEADFESRKLDKETEFELSDAVFQRIISKLGYPDIDLFATRINAKCKDYVSWTRDPGSIAVDAFTMRWDKFFFYAFPPFILINRVLQKIRAERAEGIVVVPRWPAQPWYPLFLSMLDSDVFTFKANSNTLLSPDREPHPLWRSLTLEVGKLSGKLSC